MNPPTVADPQAQGASMAALLFGGVALIVELVVLAIVIAALWKIFTKAGKPGWASIIPIYNTIVLLEIIGRPIWWIALLIVPFVNLGAMIIMWIDLAKVFGKDIAFAIGLIILPIIFLPILGFGDAQYMGAPDPTRALI